MAHKEQRSYFLRLRDQFPEAFTGVTVLEIGSLDINGTIRDFFDAQDYLGADVAPGPGVNLIAQGENLDFPDNNFDVCVSSECFEHNPEWAATFHNMWRMSSDFVIMTCASEGRSEHGTSNSSPEDSPHTVAWNYYQNLKEEDFRTRFDIDSMFTDYAFEYNPIAGDLYFYGRKKHL